MAKNSGKVIQFEPGKKKKLKSLNYVSPEKKELLRQRERQQKKRANRNQTIRLVGIFFLICVVLHFLATAFK